MLQATGGARGGTPCGRSASGHEAQAAPVVRLLTLAQAVATVRRRRREKPAVTKIQRPGTTLRATGGPRGGTPWDRSASGYGAQAASVVRLLTLAHAARWRTVTHP